MIRAAAKNHEFVAVAVDPADYPQLLQQLQQQGGSSSDGPEASAWRRKLAWKAFQHCSTYDAAVAEWLWRQAGGLQVPVAACCFLLSAKFLLRGCRVNVGPRSCRLEAVLSGILVVRCQGPQGQQGLLR